MNNNIKVNYYDRFKCIAKDCPLTCCQEWRIGVDDATLEKWQGVHLRTEHQQVEKQQGQSLCAYVQTEEAGHRIILNEEKKCPFLNANQLCNVVTELGEEYLSETCTIFPRQVNVFSNRTEYSLDTGCPVVVDLLNDSKQGMGFIEEGTSQKEILYSIRKMILTCMQNDDYTLTERMMIIFYTLLELLEQDEITETSLKEIMSSSRIQPLVQTIRGMKFNALDTFWENNELFLDVVHNYRKQKLYVKYLEEISVMAESLEEIYTDCLLRDDIKQFESMLKDYEALLKNYLMSEIFSNCLMPEMDLEDVVMGFQWISLAYVVLKQALFLNWLMNDKKEIEYSLLRDYICVISRVTGYEQDDIREYLENSFEDVIWEWGYLALVIGNGKL